MFGRAPRLKTRMLLALTTTVITFASVSSHAADYVPQPVRLTFKRSDADSPEGARTLYSRLDVAAHYACGTSVYTDVLLRGQEKCVQASLANAVKHVNSPLLSQMFADKNGADVAMQYHIDGLSRTAAN